MIPGVDPWGYHRSPQELEKSRCEAGTIIRQNVTELFIQCQSDSSGLFGAILGIIAGMLFVSLVRCTFSKA